MGTLIVFVDSLRADAAAEMPFVSHRPQVASVQPGFGYSINLHAELFAGLRPDDVGYFGEWHLAPEQSPGYRIRSLLPLLSALCRPYILNRGVQHLLTRRYRPDHIMPNIPLRHIDKFSVAGETIFSPRFPAPTLFTRHPRLRAIHSPRSLSKGERDAWVVSQANDLLERHPHLFLPLADLDGLSHNAGVGSEEYVAYLRRLDGWLSELHARFRREDPQGHFWVVSDHGMANIHSRVALDLERRLGPSGLHTYMFFSDSTLLRVWVRDERLREPLANSLADFRRGKIVDAAEREAYGLMSPSFGDYILVLDEGVGFEPCYFAHHIPKAMHGYHPKLPSQQALYAHEGPSLPTPQTLLDVYAQMCHVLGSEKVEPHEPPDGYRADSIASDGRTPA